MDNPIESPDPLEAVLADARPFTVVLHSDGGESPLLSKLDAIASRIARATRGAIAVERGQGEMLPACPALTLSSEGRGAINYLAVPEGLEEPPFVEALTILAQGTRETEDWAETLKDVAEPAELLVFVASACPHCPHAARAATRLALASQTVTTHVVDAQRFPELAARYGARSVPLTLLDRQLGVTGVVTPAELAERIRSRGQPEHGLEVFRSLLDAGRFDEAAEQICAEDGGLYFATAWKQSTMSARMGLLLVAENVLERDPAGLDERVPDLVEALTSDDGALRGDTADLLGQIGDARALDALETLGADPNPDVAEAAADAIEQIWGRSRARR